MKFSDATISEFISAYERVFGESLTPEEVTQMLRRMVNLYRVLLRPLPKHGDNVD
jgi:hypothetical protein